MKQCHVPFQAKVKSTQMLQKSHSLHRLYFWSSWNIPRWHCVIISCDFLFTLQHSTMYSFFMIYGCRIGTIFTFVCFLSPILWSNALCLFKLYVVMGHISDNIWWNLVILGLFNSWNHAKFHIVPSDFILSVLAKRKFEENEYEYESDILLKYSRW